MIEVGGLANVHSNYAIPMKYGVDQCIADTIGPGGIFKYLRTAPSWLAICRDIEELCPSALVINYTNPMSALTLTALRATSLQVVGLCISTIETAYQLADYAGVPFEQMNYRCAGINHLAWFVSLEMDGEDLYPRIYRAAENPEIYREDPIRFEILRDFGALVTESGRLISEYVPYFRKRKDLLETYLRESADLAGGQRARTWPLDRAEHDAMVRHDLERERRGERAFFLERSLEHCSCGSVDQIAIKACSLVHKIDTSFPHRKGSRGKAVSFVDVGTNDGQTDNVQDGCIGVMRVVDMLPANSGSGGGDPLVSDS